MRLCTCATGQSSAWAPFRVVQHGAAACSTEIIMSMTRGRVGAHEDGIDQGRAKGRQGTRLHRSAGLRPGGAVATASGPPRRSVRLTR